MNITITILQEYHGKIASGRSIEYLSVKDTLILRRIYRRVGLKR